MKTPLLNALVCLLGFFIHAQADAHDLGSKELDTEADLDPYLQEMLAKNGFARTPAPMRRAVDFSPAGSKTRVVMLGSGNPIPTIERFGPGLAIMVNERPYLIDAGEGIWRASQAATPKYGGRIKGLEEKNLDRLFITHHHADHISNLPSIIFLPWYLGADRQLDIYGPRNTARLVSGILDAYQYVHDLGQVEGLKYEAPVMAKGHDFVKPGRIYQDELVAVDAFRVLHGGMPNSFSFKFTSEDRVVVVSGDKRPTPGFREWAKGADLLLHEVYTLGGLDKAPATIREIVGQLHTSTEQLAELATYVKPELLVLYHVQNYSGDRDAPVRELRAAGYTGAVVLAVDQDIY